MTKPDPFEYQKPDAASINSIELVRGQCRSLHALILAQIPECRERSLAITNLEQVSMWANKAIVFTQDHGKDKG